LILFELQRYGLQYTFFVTPFTSIIAKKEKARVVYRSSLQNLKTKN
jgi:hypothetical protein